MASDYLAKYVLIGYYQENQDAGTNEERAEWSEDVFARYDHHIIEAAEKAGLDVSVESRSIMAVLATMAPGTAAKTRAGQAVNAYLLYRGL
jgi:hypothetical protein